MSNNTSLAKALANAQGQMSAADKNAKGNFGKYATLAAIWDAIRDPLSKNGLSVAQTFEYNTEQNIVMLRTTLMHESGESITSLYPILPVKTDPQGYGSATTYARKYTLAALVGVAPDDDDDGEGAGKAKEPARPQQQQPPQPQTNDTLKKLHTLGTQVYGKSWDDKRIELVEAISKGRTNSSRELLPDELSTLITGLEKRKAALNPPPTPEPADLLAAVGENADSAHNKPLREGAYA